MLNLELTKIYRNKRDEEITITDVVGPNNRWDYECGMRFRDHVGRTYRPDGTYNNIPGENSLDLVEEIIDNQKKINVISRRMKDIYDADRDYEMCFDDLPDYHQAEYIRLKNELKYLL